MLFETRNIEVGYGKIKALRGLTVSVDAGEVVTLIGANGAGKSTFMKTISGLLSPSSGEIYFNGERIDKLPAHQIARRGLIQIPEGRRIFPLLSVEENMMMGAFFRKDREIRSDLDRIYGDFPILKERRSQLGGTLSGGEQQMLAFARALMSRPKLLALDEPSMGLAPVIVDKVFKIIKDINAAGMTILLVEQNARAALSVAQRGYVMETGTVLMHDRTSALLANDRVRHSYLGIQEGFVA
jgi:branched-chain amino acid transport system ATP-binding protein